MAFQAECSKIFTECRKEEREHPLAGTLNDIRPRNAALCRYKKSQHLLQCFLSQCLHRIAAQITLNDCTIGRKKDNLRNTLYAV